MRDTPLGAFPAFPLPNYTHPETRGPGLILVNAILLFFVTVAVVLRIYTRGFITKALGFDDYSIIIGYIFTAGLVASVILANERYFWERHIYDIPINMIPYLGQIAMAAKELFTVAATFIRLSLLLFYYRLVNDTGQLHFKRVLHVAMAFNIAILIGFTVLTIFPCSPLHAYWDFPARGRCLDDAKITFSAGIVNSFADLLITALPIPMILRLHMPMSQRIVIMVLLSLGFIVTGAGAVRTYFIWKAMFDTYDETWYSYPLWIAAAVEVQLGVITACIPTLRPLFARHIPSFAVPIQRIRDRMTRSRSAKSDSTRNHSASASASHSPTNGSQTTAAAAADQDRTSEPAGPALLPDMMQIFQRHSIEVTREATEPDWDLEMQRPEESYQGHCSGPAALSPRGSADQTPPSPRTTRNSRQWRRSGESAVAAAATRAMSPVSEVPSEELFQDWPMPPRTRRPDKRRRAIHCNPFYKGTTGEGRDARRNRHALVEPDAYAASRRALD